MITVRYAGQFGNQLFQYCLGKILAERTGQAYRPPKHWRTKSGRILERTLSADLFTPTETPGFRAAGQPQTIRTSHWLDLDTIDHARPVDVLLGYFQRYELFREHKRRIQEEWLAFGVPFVECDPEAVYVHVRRTDYIPGHGNPGDPRQCCLTASMDEYIRCIEQFPGAKRLVIATDDQADPFHKGFDRAGLPWTFSGKGWDGDFLALASCRWLIMSQSTYSWWAGFLGQAERIVCPVATGTHWHYGLNSENKGYPNLYVDDEPERWTWLTTPFQGE
jgi:hypothetical protein